jgi:hypothetical protein
MVGGFIVETLVGDLVGMVGGFMVVGFADVGLTVGLGVGCIVVGFFVGTSVGDSDVGASVPSVGKLVGI